MRTFRSFGLGLRAGRGPGRRGEGLGVYAGACEASGIGDEPQDALLEADRAAGGEAAEGEEAVSRLRVVLADDHPVVRAGMRLLLSQDPSFEIVAESSTVAETLQVVQQHQPSILVLDLTMAGESSLVSIPDLLAASPSTRVLVLTMHEDPAFARAALRMGAAGYLLKEAASEELIGAAHQVAKGATYLQPTMGARLAVDDLGTANAGRGDSLTARELQMLSLLAAGHTNQEIARRLFVSLRTVETHRARIREKLGAETRAELISAARERGLLT